MTFSRILVDHRLLAISHKPETWRSQSICNGMKTRYLAFPPLRIAQQPGTYIYADHSRSQSLSFRTALVAQERIHGRHGTIRDSYNAPIAENVPDNAVFADASHRDGLAVAATIADQSQMARRDAVWHLGVIGKKLVRCCRWSHPQMFGPLSQTTCGLENPRVKLQDTVGIKPQKLADQRDTILGVAKTGQFQGRNVSHSLCRWRGATWLITVR